MLENEREMLAAPPARVEPVNGRFDDLGGQEGRDAESFQVRQR
jgi:hypothetical protein